MNRLLQVFNPNYKKNEDPNAVRYAGMNARVLANLTDMMVLIILTMPLMFFIPSPQFGTVPADAPPEVSQLIHLQNAGAISSDEFAQRMVASGYLQNTVLPRMITYFMVNMLVVAVIFIAAWRYWNSTPGKMLFRMKIVRESDLGEPSTWQYLVRFFGYIIGSIPLGIGFLMIPFNSKKRGLHDYMAGTVVIYTGKTDPVWEKKKLKWQIYSMIFVLLAGAIYLSGKL